MGGTEVYVDGLAQALRDHDVESIVCAPAESSSGYEHRGLRVRRFAIDEATELSDVYGAPSARATREFEAILDDERPHVVHLHAHTRGTNATLLRAARARGVKTVFTYHTPTVSCVRGTMMQWGSEPCDGRIEVRRCAACMLTSHGVERSIAEIVARMPVPAGRWLARAGRAGGAWTALRMSELVTGVSSQVASLFRESDRIVAVCDWVAEVIRRNGVNPKRITLCRQGLSGATYATPTEPRSPADPLRLVYFGRLDRTKGVDLLVEALLGLPNAPLTLDLYGVAQGDAGARLLAARRAQAAEDPRNQIRPPVEHDRVLETLARYDVLVVPSRWLETGPLVVLEAFAAKVPVLGMRRGGIAELVRDDVDGRLVDGEEPSRWTDAIRKLVDDRATIARWRAAIRPPRTMHDVAAEMATLYRAL
ncbi:MAG: glycosyltransferase [Polyangiales bacterium]